MVAADNKTTALTVYERMPDSLAAVQTLGNAIAKSRMFGCETVEQGQVLALECMARRMPPLTLAERYHVVQGKLMMKYDAMLAAFHELGGKHKIIARTEDRAEVELTIDGQTHREAITWEEAKQEKWPYKGDGKSLKDNWATPRARRQMLWARAVSEGVRALCPGVNSGRYVPEEIDDDGSAVATSNGNGHAKPATTSVVDQAAAAAEANGNESVAAGEVVDAEFEVKKDEPAPVATATAAAVQDSPELATEYQIARIKELAVLLQCGEKVEAACQKRGCNSVRSLRKEDAGEMLEKLERNFAAKKAAEPAASTEQSAEPPAEMPPCGPMTDRQYEAINKAMGEFAQIDPAGKQQFYENLKAWLASKGLKLRQIDATQAAQLCDSIRQKSLPTFIRMDLEKHAGN